MSVIQAKGLCWEVISYFFSGILPCADPSTEGLGIMRGLEGLPFHAAQSTQPTSLENNIFLTFLAIGRTWDKHDIPDISWVLTRCKLQLLGLFAFFVVVCLFFSKRVPGTGVQGGWMQMCGCCMDYESNFSLQYLASVTQLLCCYSPWEWGHLLVLWLHPCPTSSRSVSWTILANSLQTRRSLLEDCPAPLNLDCRPSKWGRRNLISAAKLCRRGKLPSKHSGY